MSNPYVLSIETTEGVSHQHGYHYGTDLALAMQLTEGAFAARIIHGLPTVTMALKRGGKVEHVYYGKGQWDDYTGVGG